MLPLRPGHRRPRTLELEVVDDRVGGDVAWGPVDAATISRRRTTEIEPFHRRARSWHQRMRPVDAELVRHIGSDTHGALAHVRVELFNVERREQVSSNQVVAFEIGRVDPPIIEHTAGVFGPIALPFLWRAID